jgi:hypothetical protein
MLLDQNGNPIITESEKKNMYVPSFLGVYTAVYENKQVVTENQQPAFILMFIVPTKKFELYSQNTEVLVNIIRSQLVNYYVSDFLKKDLKNISQEELEKLALDFMSNYKVEISPQGIPMDYVTVDNIDEKEILKELEAIKTEEKDNQN